MEIVLMTLILSLFHYKCNRKISSFFSSQSFNVSWKFATSPRVNKTNPFSTTKETLQIATHRYRASVLQHIREWSSRYTCDVQSALYTSADPPFRCTDSSDTCYFNHRLRALIFCESRKFSSLTDYCNKNDKKWPCWVDYFSSIENR